MRRDEWARLAAPFSVHALDWWVAQLDREASAARVEPIVGEAAVRGRLDEVLGPEGWSMRLLPAGADALVCELDLLGVTKSAVARSFDGVLDLQRVAGFALGRAAAQFGLRPPATEAAWVEIDLEAGELLYPPAIGASDGIAGSATGGAAEVGGGDADPAYGPGVAPAFGPEDGPEDGAEVAAENRSEGLAEDGVESGVREAREAEGAAPAERSPAGTASGAPDDTDGAARSRGQLAIERLVDRLRSEGLGRDAAALVVQHGGYGRSPEEARELYRKLRELLLERGTPS